VRMFHSHLVILHVLILVYIHVSSELHNFLLIITRLVIVIYIRELILHSLILKVILITWLGVRVPLIQIWCLKLIEVHIGERIDIVLVHLVDVSNWGCVSRSWQLRVVVGLNLGVTALILYLLYFNLAVLLNWLVVIILLGKRERHTYLLALVIFIYWFIY
jgi:hypothetical protein